MIELNFSNFLTFLSLLFSLFFFIHISFPLKNSQTYLSFYYTKSTQTFLISINNNLPRFCLPRYISMIVQRTTPSSIRNVNILATYVSRRINLQSINTLLYNNILRFDSTRIFLSRVNINNNLFSSPIITRSRNNKLITNFTGGKWRWPINRARRFSQGGGKKIQMALRNDYFHYLI